MPQDLFETIVTLRNQRISAALATVVGTKGSTPAKVPTRMIVCQDGTTFGTVGGGCVEADVIRAARDVMDTGRPKTMSFRLVGEEAERTGIACGGIVDIMLESLEDPRALIVGAGHVGQAVAQLAHQVGIKVSVVDDRPDFANAHRFPNADELIVCELTDLAAHVKVGSGTSILIMTRGHAEDFGALKWALQTRARYIGVLGSMGKRKTFLKQLTEEGHSERDLANLAMPIGLDIAAESVPEIAVSIVGQLIANRRGSELGASRAKGGSRVE